MRPESSNIEVTNGAPLLHYKKCGVLRIAHFTLRSCCMGSQMRAGEIAQNALI